MRAEEARKLVENSTKTTTPLEDKVIKKIIQQVNICATNGVSYFKKDFCTFIDDSWIRENISFVGYAVFKDRIVKILTDLGYKAQISNLFENKYNPKDDVLYIDWRW